jgi:uncharacterized membrane protein
MLVATTPVQGNLVLEFVMGMIGATLLEYFVGALMESVFKVKYWDYSNQHFHIKGYICLSSSICWGALSVLMAEVIHLPIERFVLSLDYTVLVVIALVVTTIFITDVVTSAKEAWNLRIVLVALTKARGEIAALQHQLELKKVQITEQFVDKKEELVEQLTDKKEELVEDWQAKKDFLLQSLKGNLQSAVDTENIKAKLDEELTKYQSLIEKFTSTSIWILKRNPGATSKKFYEALENVKEHIDFKRKNK